MKKIVIIILVLMLVASALSAQTVQKSSVGAYLLTIFIGFGTGHFYVGADNAVTFLLLDIGTVAFSALGAGIMVRGASSLDLADMQTGMLMTYGGLGIGAVVRIIEIVSIIKTVDKKRATGEVARLEPNITPTANGVSFYLSYKY